VNRPRKGRTPRQHEVKASLPQKKVSSAERGKEERDDSFALPVSKQKNVGEGQGQGGLGFGGNVSGVARGKSKE